jgi:hypothetical protein
MGQRGKLPETTALPLPGQHGISQILVPFLSPDSGGLAFAENLWVTHFKLIVYTLF